MHRSLLPAAVAAAFLFAPLARPAAAQTPSSPEVTISTKTAGMRHTDGLFPLDWDAKTGKLYLEIASFNKDFLLLDQLPYGLGSNDIGLDRGQLGPGKVVRFYRSGNKVLLIEQNLDYRSSSTDPEEQLDVQQSFARSVLWGFPIEAEEGDRVLVDATTFFLRDAHGVAERLQREKQGEYAPDLNRSAILPEDTKNFPLNTEIGRAHV